MEYNEEFLNTVKEYYINNRQVSLKQLADNSDELFGKAIPYSTLKDIAKDDDWVYLKQQKLIETTKDRSEQIEIILDTAFAMLVSADTASNPAAWSSIANVYFSGIAKTGLSKQQGASKTSVQKVLEEMAKADNKNKSGESK